MVGLAFTALERPKGPYIDSLTSQKYLKDKWINARWTTIHITESASNPIAKRAANQNAKIDGKPNSQKQVWDAKCYWAGIRDPTSSGLMKQRATTHA